MIVSNEDIKEIRIDIPEGHKHLRTTMVFQDGREIVFQEATIANIVRGYITIKTHPVVKSVNLHGKRIAGRKEGYAEWQLIEEQQHA